MKFTLVLNQKAVVDAGLLGNVNIQALGLLHYLGGWFSFPKAKTEILDGRRFVWIHSKQAVDELPLLFNPKAGLASRKNKLSGLVRQLERVQLLESKKIGRRLFFRLTDLGIRLTQPSKQSMSGGTKSVSSATPLHDKTVMSARDNTFTSIRDEYLPTIIDETGTTESETKESPPLSPLEGDARALIDFWNSFSELPKVERITPNRARNIDKRLSDPWWRERWQDGIKRLAASDFARGIGSTGWRANLDWFLRPDSLTRILEGMYDNQPQTARKPTLADLRVQLKAVDELIESHPANRESSSYMPGHTSREERLDFDNLQRRHSELVRQLASFSTESTQ